MSGTANLDKFRYYEGKKYLKVVREEFDTFQGRNKWRDTTVHAFIDRKTGKFTNLHLGKHLQNTLDLI